MTNSNFIRACFCGDFDLSPTDWNTIIQALRPHHCIPAQDPSTNQGDFLELGLQWKPAEEIYQGRILQVWTGSKLSMVSLDIEEYALLKLEDLSYYPDNEPVYLRYKALVIEFIAQLRPKVGIIDWDADLICSDIQQNSFSAWGNYLSEGFLKHWEPGDRKEINHLVDECIEVPGCGLLIFNHPLGYGDPTKKQMQFWSLLNSYKDAAF